MAYSDIQTIEKSVEKVRFHKEPAVLPPLSEWEKIEELFFNNYDFLKINNGQMFNALCKVGNNQKNEITMPEQNIALSITENPNILAIKNIQNKLKTKR